MGIKSLSSNKKKSFKSTKTQKWLRQKRAEKKKQAVPKAVTIEDVHLYSNEKLKNKLRNPKNNIKISGKKKRRLTKRLGHSLREKAQMEVEVTEKQTRRQTKTVNEDTEMSEMLPEAEVTSLPETASSSAVEATSSSSSAIKKKKRGRKKKAKKLGAATAEGDNAMFEQDDGWEDVEMAE
ncbi:hypothetical protein PoB_007614700 [Plakobranchus ocellatus]|uniref:Uncharacterized protein n=1 Tax=Plakobranchus ocellatus TaxID=259542 RepID=A0AAV4E028_9GAST|nr:hypothetical protein PoB_007614700 [Plakobranchus ocellatus]